MGTDTTEKIKEIVDPNEKITETTEKIVAQKKSSLGLPMNEASDAWMDDVGDGGGFDDSEEENLEIEEPKEKITETTEKIVAEKKSSLGLPMNEASDAWMDDLGDEGGFDDSEEENLEIVEPKDKITDTTEKIKEI